MRMMLSCFRLVVPASNLVKTSSAPRDGFSGESSALADAHDARGGAPRAQAKTRKSTKPDRRGHDEHQLELKTRERNLVHVFAVEAEAQNQPASCASGGLVGARPCS